MRHRFQSVRCGLKQLSSCYKLRFWIPIYLQPDVVDFWYFKPRIMSDQIISVWNKEFSLHLQVAKILVLQIWICWKYSLIMLILKSVNCIHEHVLADSNFFLFSQKEWTLFFTCINSDKPGISHIRYMDIF